jgi:hypothetical protein
VGCYRGDDVFGANPNDIVGVDGDVIADLKRACLYT